MIGFSFFFSFFFCSFSLSLASLVSLASFSLASLASFSLVSLASLASFSLASLVSFSLAFFSFLRSFADFTSGCGSFFGSSNSIISSFISELFLNS